TLQSAYAATAGGTPEIILDSTRGALTIRDNATPIGANLLEVQSNDGTTTYLAVDATGVTVTGAFDVSGDTTVGGDLGVVGDTILDGYLSVQNAADSTTAYQFLNANGDPVINIDTQSGFVGFGTDMPGEVIDVNGNIQLSGGDGTGITSFYDQITFTADSDDNSNGDLFRFRGNGTTDYLTITNSGSIILGAYDCSTNDNGGKLTVDASG